ncbi:MAG: hypothetical protein ACYTG0_45845 [Planctomycetota bacterium]|jgi:hypothetical protein
MPNHRPLHELARDTVESNWVRDFEKTARYFETDLIIWQINKVEIREQ